MDSIGLRPLLPVLFVGNADSRLVRQLDTYGIGVIVAERVERAARLLTNFTVAAIVCDVSASMQVNQLAALSVPVILLAMTDEGWDGPGVTVMRRDTPAAVVAAAIQRLAEQPLPADRAGEARSEAAAISRRAPAAAAAALPPSADRQTRYSDPAGA
jgi:hypothetical protein